MSEKSIAIFETALHHSLWLFLGLMAIGLAANAYRMRVRRKKLAELGAVGEVSGLAGSREELNVLIKSLVGAAALAGVFFVFLVLTPVSFIDNFVNSEAWKLTPLRVTELTFERDLDGFSLNGVVWNQTDEPIEDVRLLVKVWGTNDLVLDEVAVPIDTLPLDSSSPSRFKMRYEQHSALLYGYELQFLDGEGFEIPFARGFDLAQ